MINVNVKRDNGELYVGRMVWNRQRLLKDPETGKRVSWLNPQSEWIVHEVPHLRIVGDAMWQGVKARQQRIREQQGQAGREKATAFRDYRRPRYLFSGDQVRSSGPLQRDPATPAQVWGSV